MTRAAALGVTLRPAETADAAFLLRVYAATRVEELAAVPWSDDQKRAFVAMQFRAQDQAYRERYADGRFLVVVHRGVPAGRLSLARLPGEVRIVDLALLPEHRGRGIGSALVSDVVAEAEEDGLGVSLHVERWNRALALYRRMGFVPVAETDVHLLMERRPAAEVS